MVHGSWVHLNKFQNSIFLETDAITEWKGGNGGSRATSIWVKPDSCCGSKPYNSGDKVKMISGSLPGKNLNFRI